MKVWLRRIGNALAIAWEIAFVWVLGLFLCAQFIRWIVDCIMER